MMKWSEYNYVVHCHNYLYLHNSLKGQNKRYRLVVCDTELASCYASLKCRATICDALLRQLLIALVLNCVTLLSQLHRFLSCFYVI